MGIVTILFIAIGLSMDAFAVAVSSGVTIRTLKFSHAFKIALFFGGFQAIMPVIGWLAGISVRNLIANYDHWIAFSILSIIGIKMIYESFKFKSCERCTNPTKFYTLLLLAIATSIDALAVGTTFAFLNIVIAVPVIVIGAVTFVISFTGVYIGGKFGHLFENKIEILGGLCLVGIGIKILIEHLI